jgi:phosphatidylserine synthase
MVTTKRRPLNISQFAASMIVVIVAVSVILVLAFALVSFVAPSTESYTGLSAEANQTIYPVLSSSYNSLALIPTLEIIGVAALIIALIVGGLMLFRSSGAAE